LSTIVVRLGQEPGLLTGCPSEPVPAAEALSRSGIVLDPDHLELLSINPALLSNRLLGSEDFRRHRDQYQRRHDGYLLDRAIISVGLEAGDFTVCSDQDYDGVFISSVHLTSDYKLDQIKAMIDDPPHGDTAIVRKALIIEYGHLLPILADKSFRARDIDIADLHFGADQHAAALDQETVAGYRERLLASLSGEAAALPQGVVIRRNGGYRVLDGYHRLHAALAIAEAAEGSPSGKQAGKRTKVSVWEAY